MVFKKIIFQNRYVALETPSMENTILNFHFDYPHPSLSWIVWQSIEGSSIFGVDINYGRGKTIDWPSTVSQG